MTLDEAIKHCEEKEKELKEEAHSYSDNERYSGAEADCLECAEEHKQLAEWLKDYKRLLEEKPQGEWVDTNTISVRYVVRQTYAYDEYKHKFTDYFCPNCGARMKGGTE